LFKILSDEQLLRIIILSKTIPFITIKVTFHFVVVKNRQLYCFRQFRKIFSCQWLVLYS